MQSVTDPKSLNLKYIDKNFFHLDQFAQKLTDLQYPISTFSTLSSLSIPCLPSDAKNHTGSKEGACKADAAECKTRHLAIGFIN